MLETAFLGAQIAPKSLSAGALPQTSSWIQGALLLRGGKDPEKLCTHTCLHTHTHTFNGPFSGTTHVSRYQKDKTNLDFTEARDSE